VVLPRPRDRLVGPARVDALREVETRQQDDHRHRAPAGRASRRQEVRWSARFGDSRDSLGISPPTQCVSESQPNRRTDGHTERHILEGGADACTDGHADSDERSDAHPALFGHFPNQLLNVPAATAPNHRIVSLSEVVVLLE